MSSRRSFLGTTLAGFAAAAIPTGVRAAGELRVAVVPEVATTASSLTDKQPLIDMLQRVTGRTVKLIVPTNYAATVEAIGNSGVDLAHFGGLTYVKANARYGARALVQRSADKQFHSLFIASAANPNVKSLGDLRGKNFAFGDVNSTSGHLIPAKDLFASGINPDTDLRARFTGNHTATALAVSSGAVDAGALDESVYHKMVDDKTIEPEKARVFHTSEAFVDYVWAVSRDLDASTTAAIRNGFVHANDPKLFALLRAEKFVPAQDAEYDGIRAIAKKLDLL